jgi:hypothetical protein
MKPTSILRNIFQLVAFSFALPLLASPALANPDVYAALPTGIRVLQYGLGDVDGDSRKELAVLYTSEGSGQLALFKADAGRWVKWSDGSNSIKREDGAMARSMEITDTNGDGTDEILAYYLSDSNGAMVTRVLSMNTNGKGSPELRNILEDSTFPPGYPLLGSEGQKPSITFLQMGNGSADGLRRVYCWNGEKREA